MKNTHRIALGIAILASVAVFIWKDSIPFLSSSVISSSSRLVEFSIVIPPGIDTNLYSKKENLFLTSGAYVMYKELDCTHIDNPSFTYKDGKGYFKFVCFFDTLSTMTNSVTTEEIPSTTILYTTSPNVTEEAVTTEIPSTTTVPETTVPSATTS